MKTIFLQEFLRGFMDQMHEELMEPALMASTSSDDGQSDDEDELESVSEAESNPNVDAKSLQSDEQGEVI